MARLSSHEGGGAWPGGAEGLPPGPLSGGSLFGGGEYSGNILQGGSVLQPQASYSFYGPNIAPAATLTQNGTTNGGYVKENLVDANISSGAGLLGTTGTERFIFDFGTARSIRKIETILNFGSVGVSNYLAYSDDGTNWTNVQLVVNSNINTIPVVTLVNAGAHRYWSFSYCSGALQYSDVKMYEYSTVENAVVVTGAATVAPDALLNIAYCQGDVLVLDGASASLTSSVACKGLFAMFKGGIHIINGAGATMTAKGVAGQVLADPALLDLIPAQYAGRLKRSFWSSILLKRDGVAGAAAKSGGSQAGGTGTAGGPWQSGGGGSGAVLNSGTSGAGAAGTCFSGGSGGGGIVNSEPGCTPGASHGGAGGTGGTSNSAAGGAGNPGGHGPGGTGQTGTGGLLVLAAPVVHIGSGCVVQADGSAGGNTSQAAGGGSGGGIVGIVHGGDYTNNGTVRANGGAGGTSGSSVPGGPGGAGSVNIASAL